MSPVLEILELVKKRDLLLADAHILELEQECTEAAAAASPVSVATAEEVTSPSRSSDGGRRKAKDVELLYEALQAELWAVLREALRSPTAGPNLGLVVQVRLGPLVEREGPLVEGEGPPGGGRRAPWWSREGLLVEGEGPPGGAGRASWRNREGLLVQREGPHSGEGRASWWRGEGLLVERKALLLERGGPPGGVRRASWWSENGLLVERGGPPGGAGRASWWREKVVGGWFFRLHCSGRSLNRNLMSQ